MPYIVVLESVPMWGIAGTEERIHTLFGRTYEAKEEGKGLAHEPFLVLLFDTVSYSAILSTMSTTFVTLQLRLKQQR